MRRASTLSLLLLVTGSSFAQQVALPPPRHIEQGQDCQIVRAALDAVTDEARTVGVKRWGFDSCYFFVSELTPPVRVGDLPRSEFFMSEAERSRFEQLRGTFAFLNLLERGTDGNQWCHCELPPNCTFMPESALPEDILEPDPRFTWGGPDFYVDGVFRVAFPGVSEDDCSAIVYIRGAHYIWQTWKAYDLEYVDGQWVVREVFTLYLEGE